MPDKPRRKKEKIIFIKRHYEQFVIIDKYFTDNKLRHAYDWNIDTRASAPGLLNIIQTARNILYYSFMTSDTDIWRSLWIKWLRYVKS